MDDLRRAFRALSETHRRQILDLLLERPRPVGELVERLRLSQPATSKHLRALRDVGLVRARIERQRRIYEVCPEPLREIQHWLRPYRRLWSRSSIASGTNSALTFRFGAEDLQGCQRCGRQGRPQCQLGNGPRTRA